MDASSSWFRFCEVPAYVARREVAALGRWAEESAARELVTLPVDGAVVDCPVFEVWA